MAQAPQRNWKDRAEYDLWAAAAKETNAQKRLELLNTWKQKYPATEMKVEMYQLYMGTYQQLNQGKNMLEAAQQLVAADPKAPTAMSAQYWICELTVSLNNTEPAALDAGELAAKTLLGNLDAAYAADKKPANTSEADWKKQRAQIEGVAHSTIGWVNWQRKKLEQAEADLVKSLQVHPANGKVSYWLGTVLLAQRNVEKQGVALFHIARAAELSGEGALPDATRKQLEAYLQKVYTQFHGDTSGLDELKTQVRSAALPPEGFKIKTAVEIASEKEEEFKKSNPMLALWMSIKKELAGPNGEQYFESNVKGASLPGGAGGVSKFKGKLISHKPAAKPNLLVLGISDANTPEVTLKLEVPMVGKADAGTELEFEGIAAEFTKDPFMLTFEVEKKEMVSGWPAPAPPAKKAVKKAVPKKKK